MDERTRHELKKLVAQCDALMARVQEVRKGSRYVRGAERIQEFYQRLKSARRTIEQAVETLDPNKPMLEVEGRARSKDEPLEQSGWLRDKLSRLTRHLIGGADELEESKGSKGGVGALEDGFRGDSFAISVPDLLGFLQVQRKSGVLRVQADGEEIYMEFDKGDLVHAYSTSAPPEMRLGEVLVAQGAVTRERLDSFLFCYSASRGMLGKALMEGEIVTQEQLQKALDHQIQGVFHRLFAAETCTYLFRECQPDTTPNARRRNVTQLLLESARQIDESQPAARGTEGRDADEGEDGVPGPLPSGDPSTRERTR